MLLIRMEDEKGQGPWSGAGQAYEAYYAADTDQRDVDGYGGVCSHYIAGMTYGDKRIFACPTLRAFRNYFCYRDGRCRMALHGCLPHVYYVPKRWVAVCRTKSQCVFKPEKARFVCRLDPYTLKPIKA
jgi:hypothetical protein